MEADEYFSAYDALHEDGTSPGQLCLRVRDSCGINKIVWSSFDFMTGPELRFVWEIGSRTSVSPVNLSAEEGSVNDAESLDSSMSSRSVQYEDIDDPLHADLTTTADMHDSMRLSDSAYHFFTSSPITEEDTYLDDYMTESRSTTTLTCSTSTVSNSGSQLLDTSQLLSPRGNSLSIRSSDQGSSGDTTQASPADIMCGTPIESMNVSNLLTSESSQHRPVFNTSSGSCSGTVTAESSFIKISEMDLPNTICLADELRKLAKHTNNDVLTTSCVDSGIAGTISTHSDLSAFCRSSEFASTPHYHHSSSHRSSPDLDDVTPLLDVPLDSPEEVSDEVFVAKFVLAEQICSTQLPSNPLMHKLTLVPARRLLVGSFIFSSESRSGRKSLNALSFLMNHRRSNWFMARQSFLESVVMDVVPNLKASIFVEDRDDVVIRVTSELSRIMSLMGCLERFPITSSVRPLMIKNTLLSMRRTVDEKILPRAISGVLQSQGYCVLVGSNKLYVSKLMHTLALFIPEEVRWCCLREYRHKYDPHIRLQAIRRSELPNVVQSGVGCPWPICVIDVDRSTVCMSAPYSRHRVLRQRAELEKVRWILENHPQDHDKAKPVRLELSSCRVIEHAKQFLSRIDLLPLEESTRIGFVNQFLLFVENMALALIAYVKEASIPSATEKASPVKGSKFSLNECRKALDLTSDSWFHAVLARAELIQPDLAEFLCL